MTVSHYNTDDWPHRLLCQPLLGKEALLPSSILASVASAQPPAIADIGTGSGVWLVDLAAALEEVSSSSSSSSSSPPSLLDLPRLDGFDSSTAAFRPAHARPAAVQLHYADACRRFPAGLHDTYDVVHVGLILALGLSDVEWTQDAAEHISALLRPGGWLVWDVVEGSFSSSSSSSTAFPLVDDINAFIQNRAATMADLNSLLAEVGCVDVAETVSNSTVAKSDPKSEPKLRQATAALAETYLQAMQATGEWEGLQTEKDVAKAIATLRQAVEAGTVTGSFRVRRVVGRRPLKK